MHFFIALRRLLVAAFMSCCATVAGVNAAEAASNTRSILSSEGSGRATAYAEQHKIVTLADKTHVVWLDADETRFLVRGCTLDRSTGQWSGAVTIGEAQDNHGGPSLTADSEGYLHVVYYPHHQQVRYRKSVRPNDLSAWSDEVLFGEGLSYPTMICAPDNTLVLTARRGYFDTTGEYVHSQHMEQELWTKAPAGNWERRSTLFRSRFPRYAQFATSLAWGTDGQTLHLSARMYETPRESGAKALTTIAYMRSADRGVTWTRSDGTRIELPATAETVDVVASGGGTEGPLLNMGPLAISPKGIPHLPYTANGNGHSRLYLATPAAERGWMHREMAPMIPVELRDWIVDFGMGGGLTFSESSRATLAVVVLNPTQEERGTLKEWGHPTTEVFRLWSDDGFVTSRGGLLGQVDAGEPHWLVNIERATGHNRVSDEPGIIFTAGIAGAGLKDLKLENRVIWHPAN